MTGLPLHVPTAAYSARWERDESDDECAYLAGKIAEHAWVLIDAFRTAETADSVLNGMCHELARVLEERVVAIKRRGDL